MAFSPQRVLVVSAHQDDETLIAGDYMIKTMAEGGEVFVLYTVDGATRESNLGDLDIYEIISRRESEAKKALALIGITEDHLLFLRNENRKGLMNPVTLKQTIESIGQHILTVRPDIIFIPAYEGGHCDHDMTNFAARTAMQHLNIASIPVFEGAEYNHYMSFIDYVVAAAAALSPLPSISRPRFINHPEAAVVTLQMTTSELAIKQHMLRTYNSQKIDPLIRRHSGEDIYRRVPLYSRSEPPYSHENTLKFKACKLVFGNDCDTFNVCQVSFTDMYRTMQAAQ